MPKSRLKPETKAKKKPFNLNALLVFLLLTAIALLCALFWYVRSRPVQQPDTVSIGGEQVVIDETLPPSTVAPEEFTTQAEGTVTYTGASLYGVDVSSHQGEVDWAAVAAAGNDFAMLRIGFRGYTQGNLQQDPRFEENFAAARENGLKVGVYFFSQAVNEAEAAEEAAQVLTWLDGRTLDCPVAFDWEHVDGQADARSNDVDGDTVTACARAFCTAIRQGGYRPMIYCNGMLGYLHYDVSQLTEFPIWYAEYADYPSYAYAFEMWQFTESGAVAGIEGNVDRNIWFTENNE